MLLVSEAYLTMNHNFAIKNYCTYATFHPDGTAHAGTAVIVRRSIKHDILQEFKTAHLQATSIMVYDKQGSLILSAVYCPPKHKLKDHHFTEYFRTLGHRFVCGGDWNAKNTHWGSRLTLPRGKEMKQSLDKNRMQVISTGEPTYWPTDPNKLPDLLDFFVFKGLPHSFIDVESCYESSSDHTPVISTISATIGKKANKETSYYLIL